jgi:hypothetical protein
MIRGSIPSLHSFASRFWYHAELYDTIRLRGLMTAPRRSGLDLGKVFEKLLEKHPHPALLCYYFFFPGHRESLAPPCDADQYGMKFGNFAGEWACLALLLDRSNESESYTPKWIGYTGRRNEGSKQGLDQEGRLGMTVEKWKERIGFSNQPLPETIDDHPPLFVSRWTHSLYLEPGDHEVKAYPDESFPKWCGRFDGYEALNQYLQAQPAPEEEGSPVAAWAKIVGGLRLGGLPGVIAGAALTAMEGLPLGPGSDDPQDEALITLESSAPDVGPVPPQAGRIVHSSSITIAVPDHVPWAADQNVPIDGRHYDFIVDRATQIWCPATTVPKVISVDGAQS